MMNICTSIFGDAFRVTSVVYARNRNKLNMLLYFSLLMLVKLKSFKFIYAVCLNKNHITKSYCKIYLSVFSFGVPEIAA
jgi:hypothetical protein